MRPRIRSLLLLLLLGTLLLEGLVLVRAPLYDAVHRAYPIAALDREGRVVHYDVHVVRDVNGGPMGVHVLDETRNDAEILASGPQRALEGLLFTGSAVYRSGLHFDYARFLRNYEWSREPRSMRPSPLENLARSLLQPIEGKRRGIAIDHTMGNYFDFGSEVHRYTTQPSRMPIEWRVEDDRLVCRETATGSVVAGFGPDGYARGEKASEGERFGRISAGPLRGRSKPADVFDWLLLDRDDLKVYVVSMRTEQAAEKSLPADSTEPLELVIETRPLRPIEADASTDTLRYCMIADRRVLVFLADGSVVAEIEMEEGEQVSLSFGAMLVRLDEVMLVRADEFSHYRVEPPQPGPGGFGLETWLPARPDTERRRFRLFRPGQAVVRNVVLAPTRAGEVFFANLTAAFALLRPPPLALASALSPLPADGRDMWWWRDLWLVNGSYPGWLALSLALAAFCAWRARRAARERCATLREVRFWTAAVFLLGPIGLLWMKLVLPRVPVEAVGGARRAVNLDAAPSTSAPWPEPKPLGIEVFS